MVRPIDTRQLKTDAFSLSKALAAHHIKLSHQQCLDVLAKMGGHKTYEALAASTPAEMCTSSQALEQRQQTAMSSWASAYAEWDSRNGNTNLTDYCAWAEGQYDVIRKSVESRFRATGIVLPSPSRLMESAYRLGQMLPDLLNDSTDECGFNKGTEIWVGTDGLTFNADWCVEGQRRAYASPYGDCSPWIQSDAVVGQDWMEFFGPDVIELMRNLYEGFLRKVETVAFGYATCMELFMKAARQCDLDPEVEWGFGEVSPASSEVARLHPMVGCGEHFICATEVSHVGSNEHSPDLQDAWMVGLWHVPQQDLIGKWQEDCGHLDVSRVLDAAEPHLLKWNESGIDPIRWSYKPAVMKETLVPKTKKRRYSRG